MNITYNITKTQNNDIFDLKYIKNFLRITYDYDDYLLENLFNSAVDFAQQILSLKINEHQVTVDIAQGTSKISLKYARISEMVSVIMTDSDGTQYDITNCFGSVDHYLNQINLAEKYIGKKIKIEYLVGYNKNNIPGDIKHGLITHVAKMYEHSESSILINDYVKNFYMSHRIIKI